MPVFFIDPEDVVGDTVVVRGSLLDHLRKSLRVRVGELLIFVHPGTRRYEARVAELASHQLHAQVLRIESAPVRRLPSVVLGQAILKGDHMDWVIQKATELGVAQIVPLITERVIVRPREDRIQTQRTRWQRIAREAAQQAERWDMPAIHAPHPVEEWFLACQAGQKLLLAERGEPSALSEVPLAQAPDDAVAVSVGPEGGWTERERRLAEERGFQAVTLGPRILRAETAALVALTIVQSRIGALA